MHARLKKESALEKRKNFNAKKNVFFSTQSAFLQFFCSCWCYFAASGEFLTTSSMKKRHVSINVRLLCIQHSLALLNRTDFSVVESGRKEEEEEESNDNHNNSNTFPCLVDLSTRREQTPTTHKTVFFVDVVVCSSRTRVKNQRFCCFSLPF